MPKEKIIIIGGGVGPMAGVELHKRIIENTAADGTDQTHFEVYHFSRSCDIPDRTEFLLGKSKVNPAEGMLRTMQIAQKSIESTGKQAVFGIPCNTFHAPKIFDRFLELIAENKINIQVLHMLNETADFIKQNMPDAKRVGLMSTTGTRAVGVYHKILKPYGFEIAEIPENMQAELHDSIYNTKWGIKALAPVTQKARNNFEKYANILVKGGAEAIILGCTEIPLALPEKMFEGIPLIDPMAALARALVREANGKKLNSNSKMDTRLLKILEKEVEYEKAKKKKKPIMAEVNN